MSHARLFSRTKLRNTTMVMTTVATSIWAHKTWTEAVAKEREQDCDRFIDAAERTCGMAKPGWDSRSSSYSHCYLYKDKQGEKLKRVREEWEDAKNKNSSATDPLRKGVFWREFKQCVRSTPAYNMTATDLRQEAYMKTVTNHASGHWSVLFPGGTLDVCHSGSQTWHVWKSRRDWLGCE